MPAQVNLHDAKTHLSRLVEQAARGQSFVIAKAGKPMVLVTPIEEPGSQRRLGFLAGQAVVSIDVKSAFEDEMVTQFELGGMLGQGGAASTKIPLRTPPKPKG